MARLPRLVLAGHPHLVQQRALDGRTAFADDTDRAHFMGILREGLAMEQVQLHAYGLQAGDLRLLVTPAVPQALARLMQAIGRRYVAACNRRHGRRGTLWDGRFRACPVEPGEFVLAAMAWVECSEAAGKASSATHHVGARRDTLITDPQAYWGLGNTPFEREAAWRRRLEAGVDERLAECLERALRGGWAFGSPAFAASAARPGRPGAPRPRGRPRRRASAVS